MNLKSFTCLMLFAMFSLSASAQWDEGVAAFKAANYSEASEHFQASVDKDPEVWNGHYMLGLSLLRMDRNQEALNHLRKAYDLNPNDISVMLALGEALIADNKKSEGLNHLRKAYDLNPNDLSVKLQIGRIYISIDKFEEAKLIFLELVKADMGSNNLENNILLAYASAKLQECQISKNHLKGRMNEVELLDRNDPLRLKVQEIFRYCPADKN